MDPTRFDGLLKAITGFALEIAAWRGTRKLGQDKPDHARGGVAAALAALGRADMAALYADAEAERA
jgi:transcriptional regulator